MAGLAGFSAPRRVRPAAGHGGAPAPLRERRQPFRKNLRPSRRKLQLSFDGQGNVTLIAQGVTLQEILAEWTRLGGCYFPNADKLSRAMLVPLQFENVPELKVLDSLLRSAAGIIVAPRTARTVRRLRVRDRPDSGDEHRDRVGLVSAD